MYPRSFGLRICGLLVFGVANIVVTNTFMMVVPTLLGRKIISVIWSSQVQVLLFFRVSNPQNINDVAAIFVGIAAVLILFKV